MKNALGNQVVSFRFEDGTVNADLISELKTISLVKDVSTNNDQIIVYTSKGTELIPKIFQITSNLQIKINEISLTQPTLDDVFISYTGHELRDDNGKYNKKLEFAKMRKLRS
jgi:ABC-2 type transport system ATP-binding protein